MKLGPEPKLASGGNLCKIGTRECAEVVKYWRRVIVQEVCPFEGTLLLSRAVLLLTIT